MAPSATNRSAECGMRAWANRVELHHPTFQRRAEFRPFRSAPSYLVTEKTRDEAANHAEADCG